MSVTIGEQQSYSVLDLGFDRSLIKVGVLSVSQQGSAIASSQGLPSSGGGTTPELENVITDGTSPQSLTTGEVVSILNAGQAGVSGDGILSTSIRFWAGETAANKASAPFRVDQAGNVVATGLSITSLDIGGSDSTSFHVDTSGNMWLGNATFAGAPFSVSSAGALIATGVTITGTITATAGAIGGFSVGTDYIRDAANSMGMASTVTGGDDVRFWAGDTYANRATAPFRVTEAGAITGSNVTITGGSVAASILSGTIGIGNLNVANQGWSQTSAFTVTDSDTVAWGAGTFTTAAGTAYSIGASNTGNMVAKTYIYLDTAISTTAYQTTTTATTAVGAGKVLVAIAQNATGEATFTVLSGQGGQNIDAANIVASSITANEIAASTITAGKLSISQLSSITADLGAITAGTITIDSSGYVRGGQTAYNTGTGFFLGYSSGAYKLSIGDATSSNSLLWDGTTLSVNGVTLSFQDQFGDGNDGNVTISVDTTITRDMYYNNLTINNGFTLTTGGYRVFVKGTLTQVGSGKIARIGSAGNNGGNGGDASGANKGTAGSAGSGASALAAGTVFGSTAGPNGGAGGGGSGGQNAGDNGAAGATGATITTGLGTVANAGVAGGDGGSGTQGGGGTGGTGGSAGSFTAALSVPRTSYMLMIGHQMNGTALTYLQGNGVNGGSGGGGSGGGHTAANGNGGGGGGAGGGGTDGGMVFVAAKTLVLSGSATLISAKGGAGGTGGNGGNASAGSGANTGGGGGGTGGSAGNGGIAVLIYSTLSSGTIVFDVTAGSAGAGGTGGTKQGTGSNGNNGSTGRTGLSGTSITLVV